MQDAAAKSTTMTLVDQTLFNAKKDYLEVERRVAALVVRDEETLKVAAESIALLKQIKAVVNNHHEAEKQPILAAGREVDARHNEIRDKVAALLIPLNDKVVAYDKKLKEEAAAREKERQRLEEEARKKQERLEKQAEKKGLPPPPPPAPIVPAAPIEQPTGKTATAFGTLKVTENWTWEVTDLGKVNRSLLTTNDRVITQMVKNGSLRPGNPMAAGLKIYDRGGTKLG